MDTSSDRSAIAKSLWTLVARELKNWRTRSRRAAAVAGERPRQSRRAAAAAAAALRCCEKRLARSAGLQRPGHPCGNHSLNWPTRQTWARKQPAVVAVVAAVVAAVVVVAAAAAVARQRSGRRVRVQCASRRASGTGSEHMHTQHRRRRGELLAISTEH